MSLRALTCALLLALAATAAAAAPKVDGPQWASLTADQQQILAPLAADWDQGLSREQKQKWIGITKRYPSMKPESQKRVQGRMQKWAKLTPAQRAQAREQYRSLGKVAPDRQREELRRYWAAYQALPREEKRMFDVPPSYVPPKERRKRASTSTKAKQARFVLPAPL
jgi:Spy/CpxP family protein refolding chaperone